MRDAVYDFLFTFSADFIDFVEDNNDVIDNHNSEIDKEYEDFVSRYDTLLKSNEKEKSACKYASKAWNSLFNANLLSHNTSGEKFLQFFDNYIIKNEYDLMNAVNDIIEKKKRRDYEESQNRLLEERNRLLEESNEAEEKARRNELNSQKNALIDIELAKLRAELTQVEYEGISDYNERRYNELRRKIDALEHEKNRHSY